MVVGLRVEDRLEGVSNFKSWKSRMMMLMNEHDLKDHVLQNIPEPEAARERTKHKKNKATVAREQSPPQKKSPTDKPRKDYFLVTALSGSVTDDVWLIDSGASAHMTGNRSLLSRIPMVYSSKIFDERIAGNLQISVSARTRKPENQKTRTRTRRTRSEFRRSILRGQILTFSENSCRSELALIQGIQRYVRF